MLMPLLPSGTWLPDSYQQVAYSVPLSAQNDIAGTLSSDMRMIPTRNNGSPTQPVGLPPPLPVHRDEARFLGLADIAPNGNEMFPTVPPTPPPPAYPAPPVDRAQPSNGRHGGVGVGWPEAMGVPGGMEGLGVAGGPWCGGAGVGVYSGGEL